MAKDAGLGRTGTLEDTPRLSVESGNGIDHYDQVKNEIAEAAYPSTGFFLMNLFAAIVACYGLLSDSSAVVIGAMVIAVLLGPIAGIGFSIVVSDRKLFYKALLAVSLGTIEVLAIAYLIGSIHVLPSLTGELLSRTQPNLFDLIIALAGGAAGAYAVARRVPGGTMIGVAIATALVPPLCTVGITAAYGQWELSGSAMLLFFSNFVAIQCAYSFVLFALRFRPHEPHKRSVRSLVKNVFPSILVFAILAVLLGSQLQQRIAQRSLRVQLSELLRSSLTPIPGAHLAEFNYSAGDTLAIVASVNTPEPIEPTMVMEIEKKLVVALARPLQLSVRSILMKVANRDGYLFQEQELEDITIGLLPVTSPITPEQVDSLLTSDTLMEHDSERLVDSILNVE